MTRRASGRRSCSRAKAATRSAEPGDLRTLSAWARGSRPAGVATIARPTGGGSRERSRDPAAPGGTRPGAPGPRTRWGRTQRYSAALAGHNLNSFALRGVRVRIPPPASAAGHTRPPSARPAPGTRRVAGGSVGKLSFHPAGLAFVAALAEQLDDPVLRGLHVPPLTVSRSGGSPAGSRCDRHPADPAPTCRPAGRDRRAACARGPGCHPRPRESSGRRRAGPQPHRRRRSPASPGGSRGSGPGWCR
jgi:hypothetical protein